MSILVVVLNWIKTEMSYLPDILLRKVVLVAFLMDLIWEQGQPLAKKMMRTSKGSSNKLALSSRKVLLMLATPSEWLAKLRKLLAILLPVSAISQVRPIGYLFIVWSSFMMS
jgi:hypothetical protein